jgi:NAD(P) transhydrogenase subunit alpha
VADTVTVGVLTEGSDEHRVALDPDAAGRLVKAGTNVVIEAGAGARAWFGDDLYSDAGASVTDRVGVIERSQVLLSVGPPSDDVIARLKRGQWVIGMLAPLTSPDLVSKLAGAGVTAISLDGLPRTLSRAQGMDALSSQANAAGYRAVLVAAQHFRRFLPLLITAAGTSKPAQVLVLGAGVAGLQAIGTARRLGAVVSAYDVRPSAREEVTSLGAKFVELGTSIDAAGSGGYARELTAEERQAQQDELAAHITRQEIVITTAQVPGRRPPLLVTAQAVAGMRQGSVIVDMAASRLGGNVAGSQPDDVVVTDGGVTIVGAGHLASELASSASQTYARNISALLTHLRGPDGDLSIDETDEIAAGVVIVRDGEVVHPATRTALEVLS